MAIFGMGIMIGPVLGPILGGWLTEQYDWRWVFFVNIPIGILCLAGLLLLLPERTRPSRSFDRTGFFLLALGIGALQLMLDRGQNQDWFASWEIWIELGISISAFWMFAIHLATARNPLYPPEMLRDRNLMIGALFMLLIGMLLMGSSVLLPMMLQQLMGFPVIEAGDLMASRGIGTMITMALIGRFGSRLDPRMIIAFGLGIVAITMYDMGGWNLQVDPRTIALNGFIQGLGVGAVFVPITTVAFATVATPYRTDAAGLVNLSRSIGGSIGISILAALLARGMQVNHADLASFISPYSVGIPSVALAAGSNSQTAMAMIEGEVLRQATMLAFLNDFRLISYITFLIIPAVLLIRRPAKPDKGEESAMHMVME
jgi:DHA2 family multidrug resistance protein